MCPSPLLRSFSCLLLGISLSCAVQSAPVTVKVGDTLGIKFQFDRPFYRGEIPNDLGAIVIPASGFDYSGQTQWTFYNGTKTLGSFAGSSGGGLVGFLVAQSQQSVNFQSIRDRTIDGRVTVKLTGGTPFVFEKNDVRAYPAPGGGFANFLVSGFVDSGGSGYSVGNASILSVQVNAKTVWAPPLSSNILLATVAGATSGQLSTGTAVGESIKYMRGVTYADTLESLLACDSQTCDFEAIREQQVQMKAFTDNFQVAAGDIGTKAIFVPIGQSSVDMSVWDSLEISKLLKGVDLVKTIKSYLQNGIDFYKSLFSSPSAMAFAAVEGGLLEPIVINSISGDMYWDNDGDTSWVLSDLQLDVDISKDFFPNIEVGQLFGALGSLYPGSIGFGVFAVEDLVDPPGYNTVHLSFRHVDYIDASVPEPGTLALLALGLAGLGFSRRKQ